MKTEWIKAIITQLFALFLFIALNTEIMGWFDEYILPTFSSMNEGPISSIIFGAICLYTIIFWINRFRYHYSIKQSHSFCNKSRVSSSNSRGCNT